MNRRFSQLVAVIAPVCLVGSALADEKPLDFNRDVRPILSDKCFFCHGPDAEERKADLRLDTADGATSEGAIVPGKPGESEVFLRITTADEDDLMPPPESHKVLTPAEIEVLGRWIAEGAEYQEPWAYVSPLPHPTPEVSDPSWPVNWADRFVLSKLDEEGLIPSPDAGPVTLIRRLHFDLTGLPPQPAEVDAFIRAYTEDPDSAVAQAADALIASPHFGERMAIYWLDLVRFADTVGYHGDQDHNISPYRDWVIEAYNANMPFDQFTREQLAGDLLPEPTLDQKIATGYNRLLQTSHEGGIQAKEYNAIYAADRVRNLSAVWMGATVGCAQCHDHKFDPYTLHDHYALAAFFADIHDVGYDGNSLPTKRPPEIKDEHGRLTMITVAKEPRETRVLARGNWQDEGGEIVGPAIPAFLGNVTGTDGARPTRLDLANWLTDPEEGSGGLTARVFANRYWYLFFGTGISRSLEDFGGQGEPPSNPELLDRLALAYVESGWDTKALVRFIVTSRAYRQSSLESPELRDRDPYNQLVARQSRYRLPAEMVRDNALSVSGLLVDQQGGASAKPYQPGGYYRHLNFPQRTYAHHDDDQQYRRGLYVHWQRMFLHPMLKAMDAPSREECTAERPRSNTPTAALVLLNDPTFVEAARAFAARILTEGGADFEARITYAFRQALSRAPDSQEREVLSDLLEGAVEEYANTPGAADALLSAGLSPIPDGLDRNELAAWTAVARALLNLGEAITRN